MSMCEYSSLPNKRPDVATALAGLAYLVLELCFGHGHERTGERNMRWRRAEKGKDIQR
ncbi:hypothetical protein LZ32DRAFT_601067 [Colletotrichum eremochloae]|nr:hypothetical protein LZ32DRAFT_601067 [Colletotrichum eremochloae]